MGLVPGKCDHVGEFYHILFRVSNIILYLFRHVLLFVSCCVYYLFFVSFHIDIADLKLVYFLTQRPDRDQFKLPFFSE